jgi:DNA-binding transcriptional MerR regulator
MFRIGDFSRIARVSARLLRFYDQIGLFTPAHADPRTGYRSYTVGQLAELNRILVLKELGFNLDQVREIVKSNPGAAELRNMLLLRRNDAEQGWRRRPSACARSRPASRSWRPKASSRPTTWWCAPSLPARCCRSGGQCPRSQPRAG